MIVGHSGVYIQDLQYVLKEVSKSDDERSGRRNQRLTATRFATGLGICEDGQIANMTDLIGLTYN